MKIIAIHQPNYIPWLGYFYKISLSDCFVFLDDAQFSNQGMHNYHYIKTGNGPYRLKIPVIQTLGDRINEVTTRDELNWKEKHLRIIEENYSHSPFFDIIIADYKYLILNKYLTLAEMNEAIIGFICEKFGIKCRFVKASDLKLSTGREVKILDICEALEADIYYSGTGARAYQKEASFTSRGIQLRYLEYKPFRYNQLWGGFQSNVSVIDYLMNCGYDWKKVIKNQNAA